MSLVVTTCLYHPCLVIVSANLLCALADKHIGYFTRLQHLEYVAHVKPANNYHRTYLEMAEGVKYIDTLYADGQMTLSMMNE